MSDYTSRPFRPCHSIIRCDSESVCYTESGRSMCARHLAIAEETGSEAIRVDRIVYASSGWTGTPTTASLRLIERLAKTFGLDT